MKNFICLLLSIILTTGLNAQSHQQSCNEIIALEHAFAEAIKSRDSIRTKQLQTESYFLAVTVDSMPVNIVPRQVWLNNLQEYVTHSYSIDDIHVNIYDNVAVALMMFTQNATVRGRDRSGQFVITDIWVKRDGKWLITERHSSRPGRAPNFKSK